MVRSSCQKLIGALNRAVAACLVALTLCACGGGGGGGEDLPQSFGARAKVRSSAREIFVGDRTTLLIELNDPHPDGVVVQVRFPAEALRYVADSARLRVDDESTLVQPAENRSISRDAYLVFVLHPQSFGENDEAALRFELRGLAPFLAASIEVDANIRNPRRSDDDQFRPAEVLFATDILTTVRIIPGVRSTK